MSKNILISENLFENILNLLVSLDHFVPDDIRTDYIHIIWDLNTKKHKMELRDAYSKIVAAKNADDRDWARIEYLRIKNQPIDALAGYLPGGGME